MKSISTTFRGTTTQFGERKKDSKCLFSFRVDLNRRKIQHDECSLGLTASKVTNKQFYGSVDSQARVWGMGGRCVKKVYCANVRNVKA